MTRYIGTLLCISLYLLLTGCDAQPTPAQQTVVDALIQEQVDIPYVEPNWESARERLAQDGETVEQASDRSKKLYSDIHDFMLELRSKPYSEKKKWAVRHIQLELDGLEKAIAFWSARHEGTQKIDEGTQYAIARRDKLKSMLEELK